MKVQIASFRLSMPVAGRVFECVGVCVTDTVQSVARSMVDGRWLEAPVRM